MLPSDVAWETILSVAAAAIVLIVALLPFGALQLVRGRPIPVWLLRGFLVALGFILGFFVLATAGTQTPRLVTIIVSAIVVVFVFRTRPRTAGAVLVAIAIPWTMWWASFLADNAVAGRHWVVADVVASLVPGAAAIFAGSLAFIAGGSSEAARNPSRPAEPARRQFGVTGLTILGPRILGMTTYELASGVVLLAFAIGTVTLIRGRPLVEAALIVAVAVVIAWAAACTAWVLARRPPDRRAWEAYSWLGEWELDRYRAIVGGPALPTRQDFLKWLEASPDRPDLAWIRSELLLVEGRLDDARTVAATIPDDAPYGRVEREAALASVDWHAGGSGDTARLRAAVEDIVVMSSDERLRAEVMLAAAEVRRLVAAGDPDPVRPMREIRNRLGTRADGILWTVVRRRIWPKLLLNALTFTILVVVLDRVVRLS